MKNNLALQRKYEKLLDEQIPSFNGFGNIDAERRAQDHGSLEIEEEAHLKKIKSRGRHER